MGCDLGKLFGTAASRIPLADEEEEDVPQFSWNRAPKADMKDYTFDGLQNEVAGKMPGTVNGNQFVIKDCENADIYIFDYCGTVTVDDCKNCRLFIGPIKTSIFIRDCTNIVIVTACQQFRTRDCKKLDAFLYCVTQPIIEATTGVKFGCFQFQYPELREQFRAAGLGFFNNNWNNIHDFTPVPGESNHGVIRDYDTLSAYLPLPSIEPFNTVPIQTDSKSSVIPFTAGVKYRPAGESCLIAVFSHADQEQAVRRILLSVPDLCLVRTVEMKLSDVQVKNVFHSDSYLRIATIGDTVFLEFVGSDPVSKCRQAIEGMSREHLHVSADVEAASREVNGLNSLTEMQMAV